MKWILLIMFLVTLQTQTTFAQCYGRQEVAQDARAMLLEAEHTMNTIRHYRLHPAIFNATNAVAQDAFAIEREASHFRAYCPHLRSLFGQLSHNYRYLNDLYARGRGHQHPALVRAMRELHFSFRRLAAAINRL